MFVSLGSPPDWLPECTMARCGENPTSDKGGIFASRTTELDY